MYTVIYLSMYLVTYVDGNMNTQAYYSEPVEKDFYQYGRRYTQSMYLSRFA